MTKLGKATMHLILILAISLIVVKSAKATTTNFTVHDSEEETRQLNLAIEDRIVIKFTIVATYNSTLHFYITYPNDTVKDFGKVGNFQYSFTCDAEGEHILHFSNTDSTEDKFVTLDYEIQHYIFGIPQTLFLTMIIAAMCAIAVAVFILMGKQR